MSKTDHSHININYISYGITKTGGYRHEKFLYKETIKHFRKGKETKGKYNRKKKLFYNFFEYLELLLWSFFKSNGNINIVTARSGISAMIRNWYNRNEVWIVLHNFDPNDNKSKLLAWYFNKLFKILKHVKHDRFKVITVSPYFVNYFKMKMEIPQTYLFPNLFDLELYIPFKNTEKKKWIHLGQYSSKNDPEIFTLAQRLNDEGYYCYFSTLNYKEAKPHNSQYEIVYFDGFNNYLQQMSACYCTLALTKINEGWPRLTHESLLVGTPVVGYANGGLGDLLKESNSTVVKNIDEAFECIKKGEWKILDNSFVEKYSISNVEKYLDELCNNH